MWNIRFAGPNITAKTCGVKTVKMADDVKPELDTI